MRNLCRNGRGWTLAALVALAGLWGCAAPWTEDGAADPQAAPPGAEAARPVNTLHVGAVRGAPGDGGTVLARSMGEALRASGRTLTAEAKDAAYSIRGEILMGPLTDERRNLRVLWRVMNSAGEEVGTAGQENTVPQAVIDGAWDRLAQVIAEAAIPGVDKVIALAERERPAVAAAGGGVSAAPIAPSGQAGGVGKGSPMVQLGSWQAREAAEKGWRDLSTRHRDLLGGLDHRVVAADLAGRGTFHRLRVGPLKDVASAKELCAALANRRVSCMVVARGT